MYAGSRVADVVKLVVILPMEVTAAFALFVLAGTLADLPQSEGCINLRYSAPDNCVPSKMHFPSNRTIAIGAAAVRENKVIWVQV